MSNTDSFIEEVNEEVRRDRLYGYLRRYGWIAVLVILLIVGGAAFSEYRKAQTRAEAEALGDALLASLSGDEGAARAESIAAIAPGSAEAQAVVKLLAAAEYVNAGDNAAAVGVLDALAIAPDVPAIYRQLAQFKSLTLQAADTPVAERRQALEAMAQAGNPMRLLASEQLALIDIETGAPEAAVERYQAILADAEVSSDLQQRALQVIVALGGEPELDGVVTQDDGATATDN